MATYYQVNVLTPSGQYIDTIDEPDAISIGRKVNNIGNFSLYVPYKFWKYAGRDLQFEFLRSVDGGQTQILGNTRFFARKFVRNRHSFPFLASGFDAMHLLKRLIVAFPAGSAEASKAGFADNTIKEIGRENIIYNGAVTPPRGYRNFQVQSDFSLAASLPTKGFSRRFLLDVFQELAAASWQAGIYLAFDIQLNSGVLELQTFVGQRGSDRREGYSTNPLILSEDDGTLTDIERVDDYTDEATVVYAGGTGQEVARLIGRDYDADRIATTENNLNFIEDWLDARNNNDQTSLDSEASAGLSLRKPKKTIQGILQDTPQNRFDVKYKFGDQATAKHDKDSFPVRIDTVGINYSAKEEKIITQLQGEI